MQPLGSGQPWAHKRCSTSHCPLPWQPVIIPRSSQNKIKMDRIFLRQAEEWRAWFIMWDSQRLSSLATSKDGGCGGSE